MAFTSTLTGAIRALAARAQRPDRIIIFGRNEGYHAEAVAPGAPVWQGIEGVGEVVIAETTGELLRQGFAGGRQSIVIMLRERNLKRYPRLFWGLSPSRRAVAICHDKIRFAAFAEAKGLGELVPRRYGERELRFPAVIKRPRMANGSGVAVVSSAAELAELRQVEPWAGHRLLIQELVEGNLDCVTHCVARGGRMVWHCSYQYLIDPVTRVQRPTTIVGRRRHELNGDEQAQLERFLVALDYSGPAVFDYRRGADGRLKVFEINARFGGSLYRSENIEDFRAAMQAVITHAAPPGLFSI
ncbi:MAG: hypothetical protein JWQ89_2607 [Devosia sp.]|uniref:hypothetical protein n=1 Tax=Devosia sp. TaxID=1871048 RepID=UPI002629A845|nr:hypothetical protein [Devosia sp.]MDB5540880.1 hypothetical protein [Devosia sp.]